MQATSKPWGPRSTIKKVPKFDALLREDTLSLANHTSSAPVHALGLVILSRSGFFFSGGFAPLGKPAFFPFVIDPEGIYCVGGRYWLWLRALAYII